MDPIIFSSESDLNKRFIDDAGFGGKKKKGGA